MRPSIQINDVVREMNDAEYADYLARSSAAVVPESVTMRQARLALHAAGLLSAVETAIAGAGVEAVIEWEYAMTVDRAAGLVPAMATALGMTDAQIDALFIAAGAL